MHFNVYESFKTLKTKIENMIKTSILLVEDDLIQLENMKSELTQKGYDVIGAFDNGEAAIECYQNQRADLAILDIAIAGKLDGVQTAEQLKAIEDLPIIFLSNLTDENTLKRSRSIQTSNYLLKPYTTAQMLVSIEQAIHTFGERHESGVEVQMEEQSVNIIRDFVFIKFGHVMQKYHISDIKHLEASGTYCNIYLKTGSMLVLSSPLKDVFNQFNHQNLIRIHRSHAVNIDYVETIKGNVVIVVGEEVPMSGDFKEKALAQFNIIR